MRRRSRRRAGAGANRRGRCRGEPSGAVRRVGACSPSTASGPPVAGCCCGPRTATGRPPRPAARCAPPARTRSPRRRRRWPRCTRASRPRSPCCCPPARAGRWPPRSWSARPARRRGRAPRRRCAPWSVPALLVDASELTDPADEVRYGASVAHLRARRALADELAARGRVLPTLDRTGDVALARWRPVVQGIDGVALDALVAALPPVGRAEVTGPVRPGTTPPGPTRRRWSRTRWPCSPTPRCATGWPARRAVDLRCSRRGGGASRPGCRPPRPGWPPCSPRTPGSTAPAACRPASWTRWPRRWPSWDEVGTAAVGAGRASFRLAEVRTLHDPADPAPTRTTRPATAPAACWSSSCSRTADPSLLVPAGPGVGRAAPAGCWPSRRSCCSPSWAGRRRCSRRWPRRCARPGPTELELELGGAHEFLTTGRRAAGRGRVRGAAAGRLGRLAPGRAHPVHPQHPGRPGAHPQRAGPREAGRLPLVDRGRRRRAVRGGAGRAGRGQGAAGAAARPLGQRRRAAAGRRAGVPAPAAAPGGPAPSAAEVLALAQRHPDDWAGRRRTIPLPVTAVHAEGWIGDLLAGAAERTHHRRSSRRRGSAPQLRPYQQRGVSWLAFLSALGLGACLADDMGLGKTVQLLALEAYERAADRAAPPGPTLLICPMSLVGTWQREAARFAPDLRVHAHHGAGRLHGAALAERAAAVRPGGHHLRHRHPRRRRAGRARPGAGSCSTRRRRSRTAGPSTPARCAASTPSTGWR